MTANSSVLRRRNGNGVKYTTIFPANKPESSKRRAKIVVRRVQQGAPINMQSRSEWFLWSALEEAFRYEMTFPSFCRWGAWYVIEKIKCKCVLPEGSLSRMIRVRFQASDRSALCFLNASVWEQPEFGWPGTVLFSPRADPFHLTESSPTCHLECWAKSR